MKTREELLTENQRLRAKNKTLATVVSKAKHELTIKNSQLKKAKSAATSLKKQVSALKEERKEEWKEPHKTNIPSLYSTLPLLNSTLPSFDFQNTLPFPEQNHSTMEIEKMRLDYKKIVAELEKSRSEHEKTKSELDQSGSEYAKVVAEHEKTKSELDQSRSEYAKIVAEHEKNLPTLSQRVKSVLGSESDEVQQQLKALRDEIEALQKDIQKKAEENKVLDAQLVEVQASLQKAQEENQTLNAEIQQLSEVPKQVTRLKNAHQGMLKKHSTTTDELNARITSCEDQKARQKTLKDQAIQVLQTKVEKLSKRRSESEALLRAEKEKLQRELDEQQTQNDQCHTIKANAIQSLQQCETRLASQVSSHQKTKLSVAALTSQLQDKRKEIDRVSLQLQGKDQEIARRSSSQSNLESQIATLSATNQDLSSQLTEMKSKLQTKIQDIARIFSSQSDLASQNDVLSKTNQDLLEQIVVLNQEVSEIKLNSSTKDQEISRVSGINLDLESQITALSAKNHDQDQRNQVLATQVDALNQQLAELTTHNSMQLQKKNKQIAQEIERVRGELDASHIAQLAKKQQSHASMMAVVQTNLTHALKSKAAMEAQLKQLLDQMKQSQTQEARQLGEQIATLKTDLLQKESIITVLEDAKHKMIADSEQKHRVTIQTMQDELSALQLQLTTLESENTQFGNEIQRLRAAQQDQLVAHQNSKATLETQAQLLQQEIGVKDKIIAELEAKNATLQADLHQIEQKSKLFVISSTADKLTIENKCSQDKKALEKHLEQKEAEHSSLRSVVQAQLRDCRKQKQAKLTALSQCQVNRADLQHRLNEARGKSETAISDLTSKIQSLETELDTLNAQLKAANQTLSSNQTQLSQLTIKYDQAKAKLSSCAQLEAALHAELGTLKADHNRVQAELERSKQDLVQTQARLTQTQADLDAITAKSAALTLENQSLSEQVTSIQSLKQQCSGKLDDSALVTNSQKSHQDYVDQLAAAKQALEREFDEYSKATKGEIEALRQQIDALQQSNVAIENQNQALQVQVKTHLMQLQSRRLKLQAGTTDRASMQKQMDLLTTEVQQLKASVQSNDQIREAHQQQVIGLESERDALTSRVASCEEENKSLKANISTLTQQRDELKSQQDKCRQDTVVDKTTIADLQSKVNSLQDELSTSKAQIVSRQSALQQTQTELSQFKLKNDHGVVQTLKQTCQTSLLQTQGKLDTVTKSLGQCDQYRKTADREIAAYKQRIVSMQDQLNALQQENSGLTESNKVLQVEMSALGQERDALRVQVNSIQAKILTLRLLTTVDKKASTDSLEVQLDQIKTNVELLKSENESHDVLKAIHHNEIKELKTKLELYKNQQDSVKTIVKTFFEKNRIPDLPTVDQSIDVFITQSLEEIYSRYHDAITSVDQNRFHAQQQRVRFRSQLSTLLGMKPDQNAIKTQVSRIKQEYTMIKSYFQETFDYLNLGEVPVNENIGEYVRQSLETIVKHLIGQHAASESKSATCQQQRTQFRSRLSTLLSQSDQMAQETIHSQVTKIKSSANQIDDLITYLVANHGLKIEPTANVYESISAIVKEVIAHIDKQVRDVIQTLTGQSFTPHGWSIPNMVEFVLNKSLGELQSVKAEHEKAWKESEQLDDKMRAQMKRLQEENERLNKQVQEQSIFMLQNGTMKYHSQ